MAIIDKAGVFLFVDFFSMWPWDEWNFLIVIQFVIQGSPSRLEVILIGHLQPGVLRMCSLVITVLHVRLVVHTNFDPGAEVDSEERR